LPAPAAEEHGDWVAAAELAQTIPLDGLEFTYLLGRVEAKGTAGVTVGRDWRQLSTAAGQECPLDPDIPLNGVEYAHGPLGGNEPVAELPNGLLIRCDWMRRGIVVPVGAIVHRLARRPRAAGPMVKRSVA
jgi:hypothetical protein